MHLRLPFVLKFLAVALLSLLSLSTALHAQEITNDGKEELPFEYDEIPVLFMVENYGNFYLDVIYTTDGVLYINISDLFHAVGIPAFYGQKGDSLGGFVDKENQRYVFDYTKKQLRYNEKTINLLKDLYKINGMLYLESSAFADIFGITMQFNFRALSLIIKSKFELPVIKQQRLETMRNSILKLTNEIIADTVVKRKYHFFKLGNINWGVSSLQTWSDKTDNRLNLSLGTELLFGEATLSTNYSSKNKFDSRQLNYLWTWVDNDKKIIKQAQVGKISNQAISALNAPVIGVTVRNASTTVRKARGYYTINAVTEPNWTVELYINNVLVDYTKADASGQYTFKVPIVYGYTILKLKIYGLMGEERTEERTLNVPYTIMPTKQFEYGLSLGVLQDTSWNRFGKFDCNYGVTRFLTIGGGVEYSSALDSGVFIPYAKITLQPYSKLLINVEYDYGVKTRVLLNLTFLKTINLELSYTKFVKGQHAVLINALEERNAKLSLPFRIKKISGTVKADYTQFVYNDYSIKTGNIMLSINYRQFNINSSTQFNWMDIRSTFINSDLSLSYRFKMGLNIRASSQINISEATISNCKITFEKNILKGFISATYERTFLSKSNTVNVSFKYDLPFAKTNFSASYSSTNFSTSEGVQGSMAFGSGHHYVYTNNSSSVGKGGIALYPFLDLNNNGKFDNGEHFVKLNAVNVRGGSIKTREKDSIIRIPDLNPFINYIVEFDDKDLDNIAWRFTKKAYSIVVDPDQFKKVYIPIVAVGDVSGTAFMNKNNTLTGIGRILIKFYKKGSDKVLAETLSESDGYINNVGLMPGDYVAQVDATQLQILDYSCDPLFREFTIKAVVDGDMVDGIDFVLSKNAKAKVIKLDTISGIKDTLIKKDSLHGAPLQNDSNKKVVPPQQHDSIQQKGNEAPKTMELQPAVKDTGMVLCIQIAASKNFTKPEYFKTTLKLTDAVYYYKKNGWFNYVVGIYKKQDEAKAAMQQQHIKGLIVVVKAAALMDK